MLEKIQREDNMDTDSIMSQTKKQDRNRIWLKKHFKKRGTWRNSASTLYRYHVGSTTSWGRFLDNNQEKLEIARKCSKQGVCVYDRIFTKKIQELVPDTSGTSGIMEAILFVSDQDIGSRKR